MKKLTALLRQQSTHSAVVLLVIVLLIANLNGVDVMALTDLIKQILVALAGISVAAKAILPDAPAPPLPEHVANGLDRLSAALEGRTP